MKKAIRAMLAILSFAMAGCSPSPKATPLKGNPRLVVSTVKADDGRDLTNVVNP